jgi:NAD(P)-dependent dehydrogenase (short-subunit alcohol dehydrogenase family)
MRDRPGLSRASRERSRSGRTSVCCDSAESAACYVRGMRFENKTYLVTGGGRGIGRAITKRLVDEGARVCILEPDAKAGRDAIDEYGARVRFERGSVAKEADVRRAVAAAAKWGGGIDGAINNAGIANPKAGPTERLSLADWNKILTVNLTGAFLVAKHAIEHLRKSRGTIVNISSTRSRQSEPNTVAYSATKGGIEALTHSLAISLGPDIRVVGIAPGWIATETYAPRTERGEPELAPRDHEQHPVGRVGKPEDIAGLCAWLLSDEAGFVTGQIYVSDGGMTRKMIYVQT